MTAASGSDPRTSPDPTSGLADKGGIAPLLILGLRRRWLPLLAILVFAALTIVPLCGLFFRCGCTYLWAGGDAACNIHNPQPPYCPWCVLGTPPVALGATFVFISLQTALAGWSVRRRWRATTYLFVGLLLFAAGAFAAAVAARAWTGYAVFF